MRLVSPSDLRELASAVRARMPQLEKLADILEQCAEDIQSRDAEIDGLKRALEAKHPLLTTAAPGIGCPTCGKVGVHTCVTWDARPRTTAP